MVWREKAESEDEMCAVVGSEGAGAAGQRTSNINVCCHLLAALRHFSSTTEDKMSCGRGYVNIFLRVPAVHFTGKPRYS